MKKTNKLKSIVTGLGLLVLGITSCSKSEFKTIGERSYNGNPVLVQTRPGETKLIIYDSEGRIEKEINDSHSGGYQKSLIDSRNDYVKTSDYFTGKENGKTIEGSFDQEFRPITVHGNHTFDYNQWEGGAKEALLDATEIYNNFLEGKQDIAKK